MKTEIFRLTSIDPNGISLHENGMIDFLYGVMLQKYGLDYYRFVHVNQINQGIEEFVDINKSSVHINIIFSTPADFDTLDDFTRNLIRLDIIHAALIRLSEKDPRFSKKTLEAIKKEMLERKFDFEVEYKAWQSLAKTPFLARLMISPQTKFFDFYLIIEKKKHTLCRIHIFKGKPLIYYVDFFFSSASWKKGNKLVVSGKEKQVEILVDANKCEMQFKNMTQYEKPPLWEMMRVGLSTSENNTAYENWLHSLPPVYVPFLRKDEN